MSKFKFLQKVKIIKDIAWEGFYEGATGTVIEYYSKANRKEYYIVLENGKHMWVNEDQLEAL